MDTYSTNQTNKAGSMCHLSVYLSDLSMISTNNPFFTNPQQACQCKVNPASSDPSAVTSPLYEPVCNVTIGTTYFSACMAGCTEATMLPETNRTVFHNCACIDTTAKAPTLQNFYAFSTTLRRNKLDRLLRDAFSMFCHCRAKNASQ
jgi:hypothetical protein